MNDEDNGWPQWQRHVLAELTRLSSWLKDNTTKLDEMYQDNAERLSSIREEISMLKAKASMWGMIGGLIPVVIALAVAVATKK